MATWFQTTVSYRAAGVPDLERNILRAVDDIIPPIRAFHGATLWFVLINSSSRRASGERAADSSAIVCHAEELFACAPMPPKSYSLALQRAIRLRFKEPGSTAAEQGVKTRF